MALLLLLQEDSSCGGDFQTRLKLLLTCLPCQQKGRAAVEKGDLAKSWMNHQQPRFIFLQAKRAVGHFGLPWHFCNRATTLELIHPSSEHGYLVQPWHLMEAPELRDYSKHLSAHPHLSMWMCLCIEKQSTWCNHDDCEIYTAICVKGSQGKWGKELCWVLCLHPFPLTGNLLLLIEKNGRMYQGAHAWAYHQSRSAAGLSCLDLLHFWSSNDHGSHSLLICWWDLKVGQSETLVILFKFK